jgi:hypothetical protein
MQPAPRDPGTIYRHAAPRHEVRITTKDGSVHEFKVRTLTSDQVSGQSADGAEHQVAIADIAKLEVRRFSRSRTVALGASIVVPLAVGMTVLVLMAL